MILESILTLLLSLVKFIFSWLNLPAMPEEFILSIDDFLDLIFQNVSILGFFIRPSTLIILVPSLVIVLNFERLYYFIMWILKKIPLLGIE